MDEGGCTEGGGSKGGREEPSSELEKDLTGGRQRGSQLVDDFGQLDFARSRTC